MSQPYFVDHKRGEVNELRTLLRDPRVQKDQIKRREVIKKVIAYMTLGIDVSRLFSEMIMASNTKDLVQKKMVYLYLCTYAEQKADLAIMAINTLHKDVRDDDPMVRGLALRSLCSLRLPSIVEYALPSIRQRLNDQSPYVRKTAVLGVSKLYSRAPQAVKGSDLVDVLYNMLRDKDPQVVANCINALNEILADEGQMVINQQIITYLLSRLTEFNEWEQCTVLDLFARYTPNSEQEMYDIMNVLEDRLRHANAAVVLTATKVFLKFTSNYPALLQQVFLRLKAPLLTLMASGSYEIAYAVLSHIKILVLRAPGVFDDEYKNLYCRFNDPSCVKKLRIEILEKLANERNFNDLINEFSEYVTDVDSEIAKRAIRGIANVALHIEAAADEAIEHLLSFLELNMDYVLAEAIIVIKDLLRKYPERYAEIIPAVQKCLKTVEEEDGKVAVIWMIGEYGDTIKDAPYILEPLIDSFQDEPSHAVRTELLTATMKLFFKRPPELKDALGRLLHSAINDTSQVDVRDRALLYYRLLRYDVHEAARVVNCPKVIVDTFVEQEDKDISEKVFQEFNSLSVVYNMPASQFVTGVTLVDAPESTSEKDKKNAQADSALLPTEEGDHAAASASVSTSASHNHIAAVTTTSQTSNPEVDLLDMQSLNFGNTSSNIDTSTNNLSQDMYSGLNFGIGLSSSPIVSSSPVATINLKPNPVVDVAVFQSKWGQIVQTEQVNIRINSVSDSELIERLAAAKHIGTIASGTVEQMMKFYMYAREAQTDGLFMIELVVDLGSLEASATIKYDQNNSNHVAGLGNVLRQALASISA